MNIPVNVSAGVGGESFTKETTLVAALAPIVQTPDIGPAKTGTLTTRTDDDTGTLTMASGHGITNGQRLDVYWVDAGVNKARRGMTVGTVATNSVPVDGGAGDVLPAVSTAITAMVPTEVVITLSGTNVDFLGFKSDRYPASFVYTQSGGTLIDGRTISSGDIWYSGSGVTNPVTGATIGKLFLSHGHSTLAGKVTAGILAE